MKLILLTFTVMICLFMSVAPVSSATDNGTVTIGSPPMSQIKETPAPIFVLDENGNLDQNDTIAYMSYSFLWMNSISVSLASYNVIQEGRWPKELRFLTDRFMPFLPTSLFNPGKDVKIELVDEVPTDVDPEKFLILKSDDFWTAVVPMYNSKDGFYWSDPKMSRSLVEGNIKNFADEPRIVIPINRNNLLIDQVVQGQMDLFINKFDRLPLDREEFLEVGIRCNKSFHYSGTFNVQVYAEPLAFTTYYEGLDPIGMKTCHPPRGKVFVKELDRFWRSGMWFPAQQNGKIQTGMGDIEIPVVPKEGLYYREITFFPENFDTEPW